MRRYVIGLLSLALFATVTSGCSSLIPNGAQPTYPRGASDADPALTTSTSMPPYTPKVAE
jgi:hypothetical protein